MIRQGHRLCELEGFSEDAIDRCTGRNSWPCRGGRSLASQQHITQHTQHTSSNLLHDKDQAVTITVKANTDQLLHISTGLSLVPQTTLAALVDTSAGAQCLGNTFIAAPDKSQASAAPISDKSSVEAIGLVFDTTGGDKRTSLDLTTRLLAANSQSGRRHDTDSTLLHGILDSILGHIARV